MFNFIFEKLFRSDTKEDILSEPSKFEDIFKIMEGNNHVEVELSEKQKETNQRLYLRYHKNINNIKRDK